MKIAVCDSGLGGLDIAARLYSKGGEGELIYFNVWPEVDRGFGKMPPEERVCVWEKAFESIASFKPDLLVIGCNTLSVIHRRSGKYACGTLPVLDIVDAATGILGDFLRENPEKNLLILGTAETVHSQCYKKRLVESGTAASRIAGLPCPGVATAIEKSPSGKELEELIAHFAREGRNLLGEDLSSFALGLCCTHFGYVPELWKKYFSSEILLNPNERILENTAFPEGNGKIRVKIISKIPIPEEKKIAMLPFFAENAPGIAEALKNYSFIPDLF